MTVSKLELNGNALEYLQRVEESGEELIITDNQVPVLKVVSLRKQRPASEVFADVRGKVKYHGDLLEPETKEWGEE
ncbi:MAG TPA: hypothetical protein VH370_03315 [Humisphaera sp.]|jgi:antitoxin (DNA-binding transcriptional repressor) of toxin-antitoxin stability system|nr:hypothetical protein [Humisphaera sp.]